MAHGAAPCVGKNSLKTEQYSLAKMSYQLLFATVYRA